MGTWDTIGEYDMVEAAEWSNAQAAQGFVRTATLPASTPEKFAEIVRMIP